MNLFNDIAGWLENNLSILSQIIIPIFGLILGVIFKDKFISIVNKIRGANYPKVVAGKDINSNTSFNQNTQNQSPNSPIVYGNYHSSTSIDKEAIKVMAHAYLQTTFPHLEKALNARKTNALNFIETLNSELEKQPPESLHRFSEAKVQSALNIAIKGASNTDEVDIHASLSQMLMERINNFNSNIVDMTLNEAINTVSKLNSNLIKILAFTFLFSRTKLNRVLHNEIIYQHLHKTINEFGSMEVSASQFEYLEAISCGKLNTIGNNASLSHIIKNSYPSIFTKDISQAEVSTLELNDRLKDLLFNKSNNESYVLNRAIGLHVFEQAPIFNQNTKEPINLTDGEKESIKKLFNKYQLKNNEIDELIITNVPGYKKISDLWASNNFSTFILNAQGIALGRAYLEQCNFGKYDINTWIN
ncbi:TPA: hypothetical protein I8672_003334 [Legionella pneumophila]|nr:hypothetical protein [Legionella pneumophila]